MTTPEPETAPGGSGSAGELVVESFRRTTTLERHPNGVYESCEWLLNCEKRTTVRMRRRRREGKLRSGAFDQRET